MEGAVHRLDVIVVPLHLHSWIHELLIEVKMAAGLQQRCPSDMRRIDEVIAVLKMLLAPQILNELSDQRPFRMPQNEPAADLIMHAEEVQITAQTPMVTPLRLFQKKQMRLKRLLCRKGDPVDSGQHRSPLVAPPVGARQVSQPEEADDRRVQHVGTTAQIDEVTGCVEAGPLRCKVYLVLELILFDASGRSCRPLSDRLQELDLIRLIQRPRLCNRLIQRHLTPDERQSLLRELAHRRLNNRQIVLGERTRRLNVVVKTILDGRTDGKFRIGQQLLHGGGHQVSGAMSEHRQAFRRRDADPLHMGVSLDGTIQAHETTIDIRPDRLLSSGRIDSLQHRQHRQAGREFISPSIVQGDDNRMGLSLGDDDMILDLGPKTAAALAARLKAAGTIVWNGPVGVFEFDAFARGTETIARAIAASAAFSIAGGGDTLAAIAKYGIEKDIGYISTGGGAFLEVLEGKTLPAFEILERRAAG